MTWLLTQPVAASWAYPVPALNEENEKINSWQYQVPVQPDSGKVALFQARGPKERRPEVSGASGVLALGGGGGTGKVASREDRLERLKSCAWFSVS